METYNKSVRYFRKTQLFNIFFSIFFYSYFKERHTFNSFFSLKLYEFLASVRFSVTANLFS